MQGRIEVMKNAFWGTVCQDNADDNLAIVACKQLGYTLGFLMLGNECSSGTSEPIWLDDTQCYGNEQSL